LFFTVCLYKAVVGIKFRKKESNGANFEVYLKLKIIKTAIIIPCYNKANTLGIQRFINFIGLNSYYHLCL